MSLYLEISYAKIIGRTLDRFVIKRDSPAHYNCRCPVCGDSAKRKTLARFHILEKSGKLMCYCHNCNYSNSFVFFMKTFHNNEYNQYLFDKFKHTGPTHVITTPKPVITEVPIKVPIVKKIKLDLPFVSELPDDHPAKLYVKNRHLPDYPFQYSSKFFNFSSQYNEQLSTGKTDECRLVIPFFDSKGSIFAYQGRDLGGKSKNKYITIQIDRKIPKIFGFDRLDINKEILIVEGPLDSLFLPNCIASVNASLVSTANKLLRGINKTQTEVIIILDNEPRSAAIVAEYKKAIDSGYRIVLWPREVDGIKDINEMILRGIDPLKVIKKNTYSGLEAKLQFSKWKRI